MRVFSAPALVAVATAMTLSACAVAPVDTTRRSASDATLPIVVPVEKSPAVFVDDLAPTASWQVLFDRARQLVEWRSSTPLDGLELHLVDDGVIATEINRETRRLVHAQFKNSAYAERFINKITDAQSGTYLALYSAHHNAVFVSKPLLDHFMRGIEDDGLAQRAAFALFVHEAVHAADDRRHDINKVRTLDFRAAFAQSAVYEGHAQWQSRKLCVIAGCLDGLDALDRFMFGTVAGPNQASQSANALSRNVIEYAYVEGERFIDSLASRPNGEQALERLLSAPPVDPIQILDPPSWPDNRRELRNLNLFASLDQLDHPWNGNRYERIQTSPLKGVNLRADPARRAAAVDGFTRLLTAMASMEIHAMDSADAPVDLTILEGESDGTAVLFARTLHANNLSHADATELETLRDGVTTLYSTRRTGAADTIAHTMVGVRGRHILQLAGVGTNPDVMEAYAIGALEQLAAISAASLSN